jgi:hypothetical protein
MVRDRTLFGRSRLPDESALQIRNLREPLYLTLKGRAVLSRQVFLQPEMGVVNEHTSVGSLVTDSDRRRK